MVTTKKAQVWLDSEKSDKSLTKIEISKEIELEGEIVFDNYTNLKEIDLSFAKEVTKVTIKSCPQVEVLKLFGNKITEIVGYDQLPNLKEFNFAKNQIAGVVNISKNPNIEILVAHGNPTGAKIEGWKALNNIRSLNLGFIGKDVSSNIIFSPSKERKEELTEIAKKSGIGEEKTKDKSPEEIKQLIQDENDKNQQNKTKLDKEFPNLFDSTGKVDESKLGEIKKGTEKVKPLEEIIQAAGIDPQSENAKEEASSLKKVIEDLKELNIDKSRLKEIINDLEDTIESKVGSEYLEQILQTPKNL